MKKNSNKHSKVIEVPVLAWNYKHQAKLPTKKQERDFVDNLSPKDKEWHYVKMVEMPRNGNLDGIAYDSWLKVKIRKLFNLVSHREIEYFD